MKVNVSDAISCDSHETTAGQNGIYRLRSSFERGQELEEMVRIVARVTAPLLGRWFERAAVACLSSGLALRRMPVEIARRSRAWILTERELLEDVVAMGRESVAPRVAGSTPAPSVLPAKRASERAA